MVYIVICLSFLVHVTEASSIDCSGDVATCKQWTEIEQEEMNGLEMLQVNHRKVDNTGKRQASSLQAAQEDFKNIGAGCCSGAREADNGKLWAGPAENLQACQAKCRDLHNCGVVEYGWSTGNTQWCFIWNNKQSCSALDVGPGKCGIGGSAGVHAYRFNKLAGGHKSSLQDGQPGQVVTGSRRHTTTTAMIISLIKAWPFTTCVISLVLCIAAASGVHACCKKKMTDSCTAGSHRIDWLVARDPVNLPGAGASSSSKFGICAPLMEQEAIKAMPAKDEMRAKLEAGRLPVDADQPSEPSLAEAPADAALFSPSGKPVQVFDMAVVDDDIECDSELMHREVKQMPCELTMEEEAAEGESAAKASAEDVVKALAEDAADETSSLEAAVAKHSATMSAVVEKPVDTNMTLESSTATAHKIHNIATGSPEQSPRSAASLWWHTDTDKAKLDDNSVAQSAEMLAAVVPAAVQEVLPKAALGKESSDNLESAQFTPEGSLVDTNVLQPMNQQAAPVRVTELQMRLCTLLTQALHCGELATAMHTTASLPARSTLKQACPRAALEASGVQGRIRAALGHALANQDLDTAIHQVHVPVVKPKTTKNKKHRQGKQAPAAQ